MKQNQTTSIFEELKFLKNGKQSSVDQRDRTNKECCGE